MSITTQLSAILSADEMSKPMPKVKKCSQCHKPYSTLTGLPVEAPDVWVNPVRGFCKPCWAGSNETLKRLSTF